MRLILMRHCKSSWATHGQPDRDRPLNARGRRSATALGDWLRARKHLPDMAVVSSSRRTQETFEGLNLACAVETSKALYHASAETTLRILEGISEGTRSLLVIGHNPGFAEVAWRLARHPISHPRFGDYPSGATTVFRIPVQSWIEIGWGRGEAEDFVIPRALIDPDAQDGC